MMELRKAGMDEAQGDEQSANKSNTGAKFSKLQQNLDLGVTEYLIKLSEMSLNC
jgi:hypothetical protein